MLGFFACHFLRISTGVKISQNEDTKELKKDKLSAGNYIRVGVLLSSRCEIFEVHVKMFVSGYVGGSDFFWPVQSRGRPSSIK